MKSAWAHVSRHARRSGSAEKAYTSSLARLRNGFEVDRNMRDRDCKLRIVLGNVAKGMSIGTVVKDSDLPTHS